MKEEVVIEMGIFLTEWYNGDIFVIHFWYNISKMVAAVKAVISLTFMTYNKYIEKRKKTEKSI